MIGALLFGISSCATVPKPSAVIGDKPSLSHSPLLPESPPSQLNPYLYMPCTTIRARDCRPFKDTGNSTYYLWECQQIGSEKAWVFLGTPCEEEFIKSLNGARYTDAVYGGSIEIKNGQAVIRGGITGAEPILLGMRDHQLYYLDGSTAPTGWSYTISVDGNEIILDCCTPTASGDFFCFLHVKFLRWIDQDWEKDQPSKQK